MNIELIKRFLDQYDFDIRVKNNARWIDQKCTIDVICTISDCILEYTNIEGDNAEFTISDIWNSEFSNSIISIFSKPSADNLNAQNEYDKLNYIRKHDTTSVQEYMSDIQRKIIMQS